MANQTAAVVVPVNQAMLDYSRGQAVGAYDSVDFYLYSVADLLSGWLTGRPDFVVPAAAGLFFGLLDGGSEIAGNGYARVAAVMGPTQWSMDATVAPLVTLSNVAEIDFPVSSANWPQATALMIFDAGNNLLQQQNLTSPVTVTTGNNLAFVAGALQLSIRLA